MPGLVFWLLLLFTGVSVLLMGVSVPLILGRVRQNDTYGIRTPETLSDESIWYRGNAFGGRLLLLTGFLQFAAVISFYFVPLLRGNFVAYNVACGAVIVISLLAASAWIQRYVRTL